MTTKLTESAIETFAIELLEQLDYQYLHAPAIASDKMRDTLLHKLMSGEVRVDYEK